MGGGATALQARFTAFLEGQGARDIRVGALTRLPQGHSNETFLVNVDYRQDGSERAGRFVVRRDIVHGISEPYDIPKEFRLLHALGDTPVQSPPVFWAEDAPSSLGPAYYVMGFCPGTLADELYVSGDESGMIGRASPSKRRAIHSAYIRQLATIHAVDWRAAGLGEMACPKGFDFAGAPADGTTEAAERALTEWETRTRREMVVEEPLIEAPIAWMWRNLPPCPKVVLLHGDCKISNYMFGEDGAVTGVLDWEWSRIGDPMNDIAWAFSAFRGDLPEGFLSFDEAVAIYEEASGETVDPVRLEFYRGISSLKVCAFTAAMGRLVERGQSHDLRYGCLSAAYGFPVVVQFDAMFSGRD